MGWDLISNFPTVTELVGDRVHMQAQEQFDYKVHACSWSLRNTPVANHEGPSEPPLFYYYYFPQFGALSFLRLFSTSSLSAVSQSHSSQSSSLQSVGISLIPSTSAWSVATAMPPALLTPTPTPSHPAL